MNEDNKIIAIISAPFLDDPNNVEQASYLEQRRQMIQKTIESNVAQRMGKVISMIQGDYVVELDIDNAEALIRIEREIKQRYKKDLLIGVGDDLAQAKSALKHLEETEQVGIQVYRHEMDNDPDDEIEEDQPLDELSGEYNSDPVMGSKALNETNTDLDNPNTINPNSSAIADAEDVNSPGAAPVDAASIQAPTPEPVPKSPLPPNPDQGSITQDQSAAPQDAAPQDQSAITPEDGEAVENLPPELKTKVAEVLQNIQQNKPVFDSMKESAPELYQNVVDIVQSMVGIVKDAHAETKVPDESRQMQNSIEKYVNEHRDNKEKFSDEQMADHKKRTKAKRKLQQKNPEYNLLFNLLKRS